MDFELSQIVLQGLKVFYRELSPEASKKLLSNVLKQLLLSSDSIVLPPKPDIYANNPNLVKQAEYAAASVFCLATKHNLNESALKELLSKHDCHDSLFADIFDLLKKSRNDLRLKAIQFGHSLPYITNTSWQLTCDIKSSSVLSSGDLHYKISLANSSSNIKESLQFTCNPEELQSLVNKLKEIERHLVH